MWNTDLFPTQLVGSYVKPKWLANHEKVYQKEGTWWNVEQPLLQDAIDDAVRLAIYDQNLAGMTFATDGEVRRQTFSGHFYNLSGIDQEQPEEFTNFHNDITEYLKMKQKATNVGADLAKDEKPKEPMKVLFPAVREKIQWPGPMVVSDIPFLKRYANQRSKITVIGPVTLSYRLVDTGVYANHAELCFAIADALNHELKALAAAGVDLIQIDEPEVHFRYSQCQDFAVEAINRMIHGVDCLTQVHVCYGYSKNIALKEPSPIYPKAVSLIAESNIDAIHTEYAQPGHTPDFLTSVGDKLVAIGVLNLDPQGEVEEIENIRKLIMDAMDVVPKERISLAPDCGMWFLDRDFAFRKIKSMCLAADSLRNQFG
ncbi:cobalamin-independent methionine synthase II family protein [Aestuariicella hydrocarbonica]|uniref:Cobalamin-independent methionine synthase II family protein n=1 Tax=Pseudomaricurvus hydrocarbonicus TaxID=1470433 RepID=A0A9E5MN31_9GAMM|nr:cobalamin-independent methionine synthase II family protein [Aestuariicella hydrocarbonica]NHO67259.1 cobalamin-independent methionine synthase II family protein [Aestuariicella hydrocarbonica]